MRTLLPIALLAFVLVNWCTWPALQVSESGRARNQQNLFEPIFAYDDIDVHSVSAPLLTPSPSPSARPTERQKARPRQMLLLENSDDEPPAFGARLTTGYSKPTNDFGHTSTKQQQVSFGSTPPIVTTFSSPIPVEPTFRTRKADEQQPRHWSALENYYQKLRQSALLSPQQQAQQSPSFASFYQLVQADADDTYRPLRNFNSPYATPVSSGPLTTILSNTGAKNQAFFLPIASGTAAPYDPDFGFAPVHTKSAPGISRTPATSGIGGSSILLGSTKTRNSAGLPDLVDATKLSYPAGLLSKTQQTHQLVDDGKVKYLEWRKLPELLMIQQQQQRAKHQQETLGPWYDDHYKKLIQEEAFCGPRNYIQYHVMPANSLPDAYRNENIVQKQFSNYDLAQLSRVQLRIDDQLSGSGQIDVPVTLSAGEYPSHLGVYNGTSPTDDTYLCAATLVDESYALTLASCVESLDPKKLSVRVGEWNLNKNSSNPNERPTMTREVEHISIFPRYRNTSTEHNLALLRFTKPVEYLGVPYVCPACQMLSRNSIRANSCWTPVRNVTYSEYFDAEGEGETKQKKIVNMIELPVKLIANDHNECYRQTGDLVNFHNTNYICSADYRKHEWRARLNQTDYFGSGIYCSEGLSLTLVSILHPIHSNSSSAFGYMDLDFYRPWIRYVIYGRNF